MTLRIFSAMRLVQLAVVLLALSSQGCIAFYSYRTVHVRVVDAETGQAVPDARVAVSYPPDYLKLNLPNSIECRTDNDGKATLRVANYDPRWSVEAKGFLLIDREWNMAEDPWVTASFRRVGERMYEALLYRGPAPTVEVVVPDGYIGPLTIRWKAVDRLIQGRPGERHFVFPISRSGEVTIEATPLLMRKWYFLDDNVRYASGRTIPRYSPGVSGADKVVLYWVDTDFERCVSSYEVIDARDIRRLPPERRHWGVR